jgi:hypothetical protein
MKRKKLANALAGKVLAGKITLDDAWHVLGVDLTQKSAVPSLTKAESAVPAPPAVAAPAAPVPRYAGDPEYIRAAFAPIPRPAATKAAAPAPRATRPEDASVLKSMTAGGGPVPVRPPHYWTGIERALLRKSQDDTDPRERENARATLERELGGKVVI